MENAHSTTRKNNKCLSGHLTHPLCNGDTSCKIVPMCLREEVPEHLIQEGGLPLGWKGAPTCRIKESDDALEKLRQEMKDAFTPGRWFGQERIE